MGKVLLIDGPVRNRKTTHVLLYEMLQENNTDRIFCVARTHRTLKETYKTFKTHYTNLIDDWNVLFLSSKQYNCPAIRPDSYRKDIVEVCYNCKYRTLNMKKYREMAIEELKHEPHITINKLNVAYHMHELCPNRVQYQLVKRKKQIIFMTYAQLRFHPQLENLLKDAAIIFDEARYLTDMSLVEQIKIGHGKTVHDIVQTYITDMRKMQKDIQTYLPEKLKEKVNEIYNYYVSTLNLIYEQTYRDPRQTKEHEEYWHKFLFPKGIFRQEFYKQMIKPKKMQGFSIQTIIEHLKHYIAQSPSEKLHTCLDQLYFIDKIKDLDCCLEYISNKEQLNLVLYDNEERHIFIKAEKVTKRIYLVDATPYPQKYYSFWLGDEFKVDRGDPELFKNDKMIFDFTVVLVKRSENRKKLEPKRQAVIYNLVNEIYETMKENNKQLLIITKNKKDREELRKAHKIPLNQIIYARGTEVEGIQRKEDYTITTGIPLQNIDSEDFRKYNLYRKLFKKTNLAKHQPSTEIKKYRELQAYMQIIQGMFRTASPNKASGAILIGIDYKKWQKMTSNWTWLNQCNVIEVENTEKQNYQRLSNTIITNFIKKESLKPRTIEQTIIELLKAESYTILQLSKLFKMHKDSMRILLIKLKSEYDIKSKVRVDIKPRRGKPTLEFFI